METTHGHAHVHSEAGQAEGEDEARALLEYMIGHNEHHISEIAEVKPLVNSPASAKIDEAVEALEQANGLLAEALEELG